LREIPLSASRPCGNFGLYVALVDDEDYYFIASYPWSAHILTNGSARQIYATRTDHNRRRVLMHRVIGERAYGPLLPGTEIDHIVPGEHVGLDNRRANLRVATRSHNMANVGLRVTNKSGFKGVWWDEGRKKWSAKIKVNYQAIHLGRYPTAEEAARAYDTAAREHFGEFARLNLAQEADV
jgi:hypothetical protein